MHPRRLQLHPSTSRRLLQLTKEAEREGAHRVAQRLRAVLLNAAGHTSGELADILKAPRSKVSEWLSRYEGYGLAGLLEGYRSGRPAQLSETQRIQLEEILRLGPVAYGLDAEIWTSPLIARVITERFGIQYHPGHVRRLMRGMERTSSQPNRSAHARGNAPDRWHRRTDPHRKIASNSSA